MPISFRIKEGAFDVATIRIFTVKLGRLVLTRERDAAVGYVQPGRSDAGGKRTRQAISANRMSAPIGIDR